MICYDTALIHIQLYIKNLQLNSGFPLTFRGCMSDMIDVWSSLSKATSWLQVEVLYLH